MARAASGVYAIVVAGGEGKRMGTDTPKQFLPLVGLPILAHTLRRMADVPLDGIVVALPAAHLSTFEREIRPHLVQPPDVRTVAGGDTRAGSVLAALQQLPAQARTVLVHDGVRPLFDADLCERVLEGVRQVGACVPAVPISDTLKEVAAPGGGIPPATPAAGAGGASDRVDSTPRLVARTVDRDRLVAAQTPQGFDVALLRRAYADLGERAAAATDCSQLVEAIGERVAIVEGSAANIKVTLPFDVAVAQLILEGMR